MEEEMQQGYAESRDEIDLGEIFKSLLHKWWVLLACLVAGALVGMVFTMATYSYRPIYYAEVNMMLSDSGTDAGEDTPEEDMVISETTVTPALLRTTIYYLDTDLFRDGVKEKLGASFTSELVGAGTYDSVLMETRSRSDEIPEGGIATAEETVAIYYIFDTNTSSFRACISGGTEGEVRSVADALVTAIPESVSFNFSGSTDYNDIRLIQVNRITVTLENPNEAATTYVRNIAIFAAMCLVIGAVVIVAVHLLDNRIKSADDIAGVTGVSVLGIIPKLPEEEEKGKSGKSAAGGSER